MTTLLIAVTMEALLAGELLLDQDVGRHAVQSVLGICLLLAVTVTLILAIHIVRLHVFLRTAILV